MSKFSPLQFQKNAIDELVEKFKILWENPANKLPIVFKSPTGSGKTFMVAHFIQSLNHQPNWDYDKAFVWITFSDDLALQSKEKFRQYFGSNLENDLLTIADFNRGKLKKNDILFINWQKIVSRSAETRVLRRPVSEDERKETGYYFEDIVETTHKENREIIFIIDESHTHLSELANQSVIDVINPKIILKVSATPKPTDIPNREDEDDNKGYFVKINRQLVVDEGLIKEQILTQTEDELKKEEGKDTDEIMLSLAISKRLEIVAEYQKLEKNINPLVLIQLPNDDKSLIEQGQKTKEQIVLDYLSKLGISENKIALWFDGKQKNMEFITDNDNSIDFMLFKQAAGTGWDCPRAHIIVMFREIKSPTFKIQTIGRILRMAEPNNKSDFKNSLISKTGYLITNYSRNDVNTELPTQIGNKPYEHTSKRIIKDEKNINLKSDFIPRIDYGDLADAFEFQKSFINSFCNFFNFNDLAHSAESRIKIEQKGVNLDVKLTNQIIVDAQIKDFDKLNIDLNKTGHDKDFNISKNDIEKLFNYYCYNILTEQDDDETKITNIARSWSPLKSSIRVWLGKYLFTDNETNYKIVINDLQNNASSIFRRAIHQALKEYYPIRKKIIETKNLVLLKTEAPEFTILPEYYFTNDYKEIDVKLCAIKPFYLLENYNGRENELAFLKYIDSKSNGIEWWFKNGASGKDAFGLKYFNTSDDKESLFYPDWIILFKNGKIGIFDTKSGITAKHTEGRAEGMANRIVEINKKEKSSKYFGGIVIKQNEIWYYHDCNHNISLNLVEEEIVAYSFNESKLSKNWIDFETIFS